MGKYGGKSFGSGKGTGGGLPSFRPGKNKLSIKSNRFNLKPGFNSTGLNSVLNAIIEIIKSILSGLPEFARNYRTTIIGLITGIIIAFIIILVIDFKKVQNLTTFQPDITTRIYDKNDILISELFKEKREIVPFEKIPRHLVNAFVSIEDNEFYEHWGVNPRGIVRAFFVNIFAGGIKQGGSTITQQLAKILLTSRERSLYRKAKEACIALMIEAKFSKDEILKLYLNQIFLGHGAYGVQSASKLYFQKNVWELNLAECAILATLPSAPNLLSPIKHPKSSISRHKIVLGKMVEMGYITVDEAENAFINFWPDYLYKIGDIPPTITTFSSRIDKAPWFTEYIRRDLVKRYGEEMVFSEGLSVYTTLDVNKQIAGQKILKSALDRQSSVSGSLSFKNDEFLITNFSDEIALLSYMTNFKDIAKKGSAETAKLNSHLRANVIEELEALNFLTGLSSVSEFIDKYKTTYSDDREQQRVEGCIISINQQNGYIEAMIGGGEFSSINQLNRTMQSRRQPGSSIKPLLYTAAIESGKFTAATSVLDSPIVYLDTEGGDWLPENYEGEYYGFVRLRRALEKSINVISIRIADTIGIDMVMNYYAKLLKMNDNEKKSRIPRNLSIALGSIEVSPYELTRAYAILANGGRDVIPFSIRHIKNRKGEIIENKEDEINRLLEEKRQKGDIQIVKPETAQVLISMLKSVITSGTARAASIGRPVGGKTGTTNNWKDAWFLGFTPNLTTGLWIGYDKLGLSLGIGQAAGGIAAPVWGDYMREALKNDPVLDFPVYAPLVTMKVCANSGLLPGPKCISTIDEVFSPAFVPDKECNICSEMKSILPMATTTPDENIVRGQKKTIMKNIKEGKKDTIINSIGNELLQ
ncbi:MAG TPA: PBP1A family penicillin-binding protein [Spirochaetota bacterium]|nr:PBP1A family penicillin-binding protein [Spirochaetota bacterium]